MSFPAQRKLVNIFGERRDTGHEDENREELVGVICSRRHSWGAWKEVRFYGEGDGSGLYEPKKKRICNFCGTFQYNDSRLTYNRFGVPLFGHVRSSKGLTGQLQGKHWNSFRTQKDYNK